MAPAPSVRINTVFCRPHPGLSDRGVAARAFAGDGDVVGGRVGAGVPGPQQHLQRFAGAGGSVVDEGAQRMEAVAAFERRPGVLLVRVRGHERGVQVDDQRRRRRPAVVGCALAGQRPHPGPRSGPRGRDRRQGPVTSSARASISRDTVGSDATDRRRRVRRGAGPHRPGSPRRSPTPTARSSTILPGRGRRAAYATAAARPTSRRRARSSRIVSTSTTPPA